MRVWLDEDDLKARQVLWGRGLQQVTVADDGGVELLTAAGCGISIRIDDDPRVQVRLYCPFDLFPFFGKEKARDGAQAEARHAGIGAERVDPLFVGVTLPGPVAGLDGFEDAVVAALRVDLHEATLCILLIDFFPTRLGSGFDLTEHPFVFGLHVGAGLLFVCLGRLLDGDVVALRVLVAGTRRFEARVWPR